MSATRIFRKLEAWVVCRDGVHLHPGAVAQEMPTPALVVVPGLDDDLSAWFELNRRWVGWIRR
jgi:hypothetical protein